MLVSFASRWRACRIRRGNLGAVASATRPLAPVRAASAPRDPRRRNPAARYRHDRDSCRVWATPSRRGRCVVPFRRPRSPSRRTHVLERRRSLQPRQERRAPVRCSVCRRRCGSGPPGSGRRGGERLIEERGWRVCARRHAAPALHQNRFPEERSPGLVRFVQFTDRFPYEAVRQHGCGVVPGAAMLAVQVDRAQDATL